MKKETFNKRKNAAKETSQGHRLSPNNTVGDHQRIITSFELVPVLTARRLQKMIDQHFQDIIDTT